MLITEKFQGTWIIVQWVADDDCPFLPFLHPQHVVTQLPYFTGSPPSLPGDPVFYFSINTCPPLFLPKLKLNAF